MTFYRLAAVLYVVFYLAVAAVAIYLLVLGEYIGKIYLETKARPRFIIEEFLNEKE